MRINIKQENLILCVIAITLVFGMFAAVDTSYAFTPPAAEAAADTTLFYDAYTILTTDVFAGAVLYTMGLGLAGYGGMTFAGGKPWQSLPIFAGAAIIGNLDDTATILGAMF